MSAVSGSGPDRDLWPWAVGGRKSSGAQEEERQEQSVPEGAPGPWPWTCAADKVSGQGCP
jgi:hypothetical protein